MAMLKDGKYVDNAPVTAYPSRAQYLNGEATFEEYYGAVAKTAGVSFRDSDMLARVQQCLAGGDYHLNRIPLSVWDNYSLAAKLSTGPAFKAHGDFWSLAGGVCLAKQAAKNAVAELEVGK